MIEIVGLDHLQLAMPRGQEAEARRFYSELLGLTEVAKPAPLESRGGCWFEGQGVKLHLGVEEEFRPARKAHPCFRVADLERSRQALGAAGVTITPDESIPWTRRFYAADPFGNRLEFLQEGDSFFP
jgi:catechol 2,3-dioxygenase-like lactoylglutathione lyase family enzyme